MLDFRTALFWIFKEKSFYRQNVRNGSSVRNGGPLLFLTSCMNIYSAEKK